VIAPTLSTVKMVKVPRGIGFWGDMVLTLRDGSLELRAVPKFRDIYNIFNEKVAKIRKGVVL